MKVEQQKKHPLVLRITVDEKIGENLMRILISSLAEEVKEFRVGNAKWTEEEEKYVNSKNYADEMGIPKSKLKEFPFSEFHEGQVFLSGKFKIIGKKKSPKKFLVGDGYRKCLPIEAIVKEETKQLYYKVVERGGENV